MSGRGKGNKGLGASYKRSNDYKEDKKDLDKEDLDPADVLGSEIELSRQDIEYEKAWYRFYMQAKDRKDVQ